MDFFLPFADVIFESLHICFEFFGRLDQSRAGSWVRDLGILNGLSQVGSLLHCLAKSDFSIAYVFEVHGRSKNTGIRKIR